MTNAANPLLSSSRRVSFDVVDSSAAQQEGGDAATTAATTAASSSAKAAPQRKDSEAPPRTVGVLGLAFMAYMAVAAGPYGIEDAVGAAGALPVLIACLVLPIFWGLPQALITAEMSTLCDENGGYVLWVRRGLGNFAGWMSSYNSVGSNLCDLPLYATLFADYIERYLVRAGTSPLSSWESWGLKAFSLLVILALNMRGIASVSVMSGITTLFIVVPFMVEPIVAANDVVPTHWVSVASDIQWPTFVATCLWLWQGWDGLGCVAGEVVNGRRSYPLGIALALVFMTLTYVVPVAVGICIVPDLGPWSSGELEVIASRLAPWLGVWVGLGAMISQIGNFNVVMCNSARALWAMARRKMVPSSLAWSWRRYHTPVAAILFHGCTTALLMTFGFAELVIMDTFFNNVSLLLESASFLALRHRDPHAHRPFKVPGGLIGAWGLTTSKVLVIGFGLATAGWRAWAICGGCNLLFVALYFLRNCVVAADDPVNAMDAVEATPAAGVGAGAGAGAGTAATGAGPLAGASGATADSSGVVVVVKGTEGAGASSSSADGATPLLWKPHPVMRSPGGSEPFPGGTSDVRLAYGTAPNYD